MKKLLFILAFSIAVSLPLFAQNEQDEPDYFVVNIPIQRIYSHSKGYIVSYRKSSNETHRVCIPASWFKKGLSDSSTRKSEIVKLPPGQTWPHLAVVYNKGELSHVKLYIRPELGHFSWGALQDEASYDAKFDTDKLDLQFGASKQ